MEELVKNTTDSGKISEEYKIPTLSEENNDYWRDYDYGKTQEKLRIGREVKGNSNLSPKLGTSSRTTGQGTGTQSITGIGFKPSMVEIHSGGGGAGSNGTSDGITDGTSSYVRYFYFNAGTTIVGKVNALIYINAGGNVSWGSISTLDSDGFTINWINMQVNVDFYYKCYP